MNILRILAQALGVFLRGLFSKGRSTPQETPYAAPVPLPRPPGATPKGVDINSFVDWMGETEGTKDHMGSEGQYTYAYGILPATAKALKVPVEMYPNRKEFARVVYAKMLAQMVTLYPRVPINEFPRDVAHAVFSFYINLGAFSGNTLKLLEANDVPGAFRNNLLYVTYVHKASGSRYLSKGLMKRRAEEWNAAAPAMGLQRIREVRIEGTKEKPKGIYVGNDGKPVLVYDSMYKLSPDNSMSPVRL